MAKPGLGSELGALVKRAEELFDDLDLKAVRAWKEAGAGRPPRRAIGYMPIYVPRELIMKWFELLRQEYNCPVAMLQVPYQSDGHIHPHHRDYIVRQLREEVIPQLERVSGRRYDEDRLREMMRLSAQAENDLVWVLESAKNVPSPIDAYFGGVYYIGPMFSAFRGTPAGVDYYRTLRAEVGQRLRRGFAWSASSPPPGWLNGLPQESIIERLELERGAGRKS